MGSRSLTLSLRLSLLASLGLLPLGCEAGGPTCSSPQTNSKTGEVTCGEGYAYKPVSNHCKPGEVDLSSRSLPVLTQIVDCTNDASVCDAYRFSTCNQNFGPDVGMKVCGMGCATEEDCSPGAQCVCNGDTFGTCRSDACASDADCEQGYHCASAPQGCGSSAFSCQTPDDECFSAKDCPGDNQFCLDDGDVRHCGEGYVCGRPFLVESTARVAVAVARGDWKLAGAGTPATAHLSEAERGALARHWTLMGQMEHASIAAFARFSLQLLALGAIDACSI